MGVCDGFEWIRADPTIGLLVYTFIVHAVLMCGMYYIYTIRKKLKSVQPDLEKKLLAEFDPLVPEEHSEEMSPRQRRHKLKRTKSVPLTRVVSEYDTVMSASKPREVDTDKANPHLSHHYEEVGPSEKDQTHFGRILEQVATTLSVVYSDTNNQGEGEVYEKFLAELISRIRPKCPQLYNILNKENYSTMSKHHYAQIKDLKQDLEKTKTEKSDDESTEESTYATYLSQNKFVLTKTTEPIIKKTQLRITKSFGSVDHLKYLVESQKTVTDKDPDYLQPNRYSATPNCPEHIRQLCEKQNLITSSMNAAPDIIKMNYQQELMQIFHSSKNLSGGSMQLQPTPELHRNFPNSKIPPRVPLKLKSKSESVSSEDIL